jgi:hypothetical protein
LRRTVAGALGRSVLSVAAKRVAVCVEPVKNHVVNGIIVATPTLLR